MTGSASILRSCKCQTCDYADATAVTGAANAGVPLAKIVQSYGWNAYFASLVGACGVVLLLMAPMTNLKSYSQRQAEAELKAA